MYPLFIHRQPSLVGDVRMSEKKNVRILLCRVRCRYTVASLHTVRVTVHHQNSQTAKLYNALSRYVERGKEAIAISPHGKKNALRACFPRQG